MGSDPFAAPLFVYGTLLRGEKNHGLLRGARFVAEATTPAGFALVSFGEHPGLVREGVGTVRGELWLIDAEVRIVLDRFEEHPRFFRREPIELADGRRAEVYVPAVDVAHLPRIAGGDWRRRGDEPTSS